MIGYHTFCGTKICDGCIWKHGQVLAVINAKRALKDPPKPPLERNCAFCRTAFTCTNEESVERIEARMALGDSNAFEMLAESYQKGLYGQTRDTRKAFELYLRAAELGSANALHNISCMYWDGDCVERDPLKQEHYLKLAAKKGHILARRDLGHFENDKGNSIIAVKHWMMSASAGHDDSLLAKPINKVATNDQFEKAIRANHAAKKEMQRRAGEGKGSSPSTHKFILF